ncbi:MAG TPA: hypothetical protein VMI93_04875 [Candidatus Solibacter sp.]|nr:hypothetical protein [Candidatus Solibacter sp.]
MPQETIIALACLLLAAAAALFIFYFRPDPVESSRFRTRLDQLLERRDSIYENLRDLRFEYRSGKFSEHDYEQVRESLEAEAATVLSEIDSLTGDSSPRARSRAAEAVAADPRVRPEGGR